MSEMQPYQFIPLTMTFTDSRQPAPTTHLFGSDIRSADDVRRQIAGSTITERAVLGALCEIILEALEPEPLTAVAK